MNEEISSKAERVSKIAEKFQMARRNQGGKPIESFPLGYAGKQVWVTAIASHCIVSTKSKPLSKKRWLAIIDQAKKHLLVISSQGDRLEPAQWFACDFFYDASAIWTAIDQISNENQQWTNASASLVMVALDPRQQRLEQVETAVDITDGISAPTFCARRSVGPTPPLLPTSKNHVTLVPDCRWQSSRASFSATR